MVLLTLSLSLLAFLIASCGCWHLWYLNNKRKVPHVPSYVCVPFVGHSLYFLNRTATLRNIGQMLDDLGDTFLSVLGVENYIITKNYELVEKALSSTKHIEKASAYKFMHNWLSKGLVTSGGAKWRHRRRMLTPTYQFQILKQFIAVFDSVGNNLVTKLTEAQNKSALDIYPLISLSTLDIICETAMGVQINALIDEENGYVRGVQTMGRIFMERLISPIQQFDILYKFTENYQTEQETLQILHYHTKSVIRKRRNVLLKTQEEVSVDEGLGRKRKMAFLDMLLQMTEDGIPLSDADIQEEVDTFMFAGHDATASAISFALFEISNHPEIQRKVLEEQISIFGIGQRPLTYPDLNCMKYLDLVIKESLRLYPSFPFYARRMDEDFKINERLTIPKGFSLFITAYHMHRDPMMYENANEFIPERFLSDQRPTKKPYSYIPFSAGPRNCIGQKFAIMKMKAIISKIIRNFELSPTIPQHNLELTVDMILNSKNGIVIQLKERDI